MENAQTFLLGAGASRVLAGIGLVTVPEMALRFWLGSERPGDAPLGAPTLARALGMREVAIGFGTLRAAWVGETGRPWLLVGAACDATDALLTIAQYRRLPRPGRSLVLAVATVSALAQLYAAAARAPQQL